MLDKREFNKERSRLFAQTRGLLGLTLFGALYWLLLGLIGFLLPPRQWILAAFGLVLLSAPVALMVIKHVYWKRLAELPLTPALLVSVVPVLMSLMLLIPTYHLALSLLPVVYVVSLALLWPVIGWLFDQKLYLMHALVRTVLTLLVWLTVPEHASTLLPIAVGGLYLLTSKSISTQLRQLERMA